MATNTSNKPCDPLGNAETTYGRMHSPRSACDFLGCGVTKLYELLGAGLIEARKLGSRTIIPESSLSAYRANLPRADIRTGRRRAGGIVPPKCTAGAVR